MQTLKSFQLYLIIFAILFLSFNNFITSMLVFIVINIVLATYVIATSNKLSQKIFTILVYGLLLTMQIGYCVFMLNSSLTFRLDRISFMIITYSLLFASFVLQNYLNQVNFNYMVLRNSKVVTLSFDKISQFKNFLQNKKEFLNKSAKLITRDTIEEVMQEVARNNSFTYINKESLSDEYFEKVVSTLDNPYIYIVLSDTGSATSKVLSLVSQKNYNHVSISFDSELTTLISYNGGERVNPPGLNAEMIEYLVKKEDASIYVYKLSVTKEQKQKMLDKIEEINLHGSAYNLVGLLLKRSHKPNIMYCSQFVYTLLKHADATYFEKNPLEVRPTDLIELDYDRKLELDYKIKFNDL